jgi:hypothetical protein
LSDDWRLGITYNAALQLATIALAAEGFRAGRERRHERTILSLRERRAAKFVVPLPQNGSNTRRSEFKLLRRTESGKRSGNIVKYGHTAFKAATLAKWFTEYSSLAVEAVRGKRLTS